MKNLFTLAAFALLALFTSACALNMSNMPLNSQEKGVVDAIYSVFEEHDIAVLQDWGTDRMIVGAKMGHIEMGAHHGDMVPRSAHDEHKHAEHHAEHHKKDKEKEKMAIMIKKATPDPAGGFGQPIFKQGNAVFCYQELYVAIVENGTIIFSKTLPVEKSHLREEDPLEPSVIKGIASKVGGTIQEGKILLP